MQKHSITLADGRNLDVHTAGTPGSKAIVFHHGTPGSALSWQSWLDDAAMHGVFAIAYSRPGYSTSARSKGRTVISNSTDIAELLKHFGVAEMVSIGWSGGGPHALADTNLPQCLGAITLAGVGEYGVSDLDFLADMGEENHIEFGAALKGEAAIELWMQENSGPMAEVTGEQLIEAFGGLIGDADKAALTGVVAEQMAEEYRDSLSCGYFGWLDDDLAFVQHWGFEIREISKPVQLWQGNDDFMVPHAHGKWLATKIPTAELIFVAGEGHISMGQNAKKDIITNAVKMLNA
jgi:pimeloyl-ACP methyl ester carboxylesterase